MNSEFLLKRWRNADPSFSAKSRWQERVSSQARGGTRNDKNAIVAVQWLVAIATSYLVFAMHAWDLSDSAPALLILACLISAAVLQRLPDKVFEKRAVEPGLLALDSILIVGAITLTPQIPWDLLILFFFCVFIAATGENLIHIAVGCVLLTLAFLLFASPHAVDASTIDPNFLFRVPFMFGISIVYGHLASQIKQERKRVEQLEDTMRLRREFVCALAHDIKAPLNVILGHAELLADANGVDRMQRSSSFSCIRQNANRIVKLVTDFLDASKLQALKPPSRNVIQMNTLVEDVVFQQMVTAREKNITVTCELDRALQPVAGDENQLQRVLWNLIDNAIKFTPQAGSIAVTSRMIKKNISIKVQNTGPGISAENQSILFCEFQRLKEAGNTEGTGLGLFIVKTIVEAHGGSVAVESQPGVGTTFTVVLPASRRSLRDISSAETRQTPPKQWSSEAA